jgi:site-specific DNA-methyltransferase (adenine-specific)
MELINKIFNGDCITIMKQIPDHTIDLIPFEDLWREYKRIIKTGGAIILTGSQPFTSKLVLSNPKWFKYEWIWEKNICSNFALAKIQPLKKHESVLVFSTPKIKTIYYPQDLIKCDLIKVNSETRKLKHFSEKTTTYKQEWTNYPKSILNFDSERGLHPTQKPVKLFEYLIKTYSKEGDLVLDNCAGSGTTAVACVNTNRNYLLIEKDLEYFKMIGERLK